MLSSSTSSALRQESGLYPRRTTLQEREAINKARLQFRECLLCYLDHAVGAERTDEPLQAARALCALVAAGEQQPVAVDGDVLDDSIAAIVRDRFRVHVGCAVAAIEGDRLLR